MRHIWDTAVSNIGDHVIQSSIKRAYSFASDGTKNLGDEPYPTELLDWEKKFNSQYLELYEDFPVNVSDVESEDSDHKFFDSEDQSSDSSSP